jgi:biotin carboxyl carrier protein
MSTLRMADELNIDQLYKLCIQCVDHFDSVFFDIVRLNKEFKGAEVKSQIGSAISRNDVSDSQCEVIVQLSGFLRSIFIQVEAAKLKDLKDQSSLKCLNIQFPALKLQEESVIALNRKITLLQDMLVNELNRSENLENDLRKVENELLDMTDRRDKLQNNKAKDHSSTITSTTHTTTRLQVQHPNQLIAPPAHPIKEEEQQQQQESRPHRSTANITTATTVTATTTQAKEETPTPSSHVGKFVRKQFDVKKYFGVVKCFKDPWFLVSERQ